MTSTISAGTQVNFHADLKISDIKNWHDVPASAVVPMPPEVKAQAAASKANVANLNAEYQAATAANPDFYSPKSESNAMYETNVATLPEAEVQPRIEYITNLIKSGEADKYSFQAGNGEQTTTSIHQFLFWLQQRAQDLDSDGTYSPDMFN